uniref:Uncharacterized protein n=1 Tax=Pithovirus LCPAC403 TaxID=2506596 RepID=A0A481ZE23_9VIRU|nr:MAG: hypothetical protein LCPAC403_00350 [Pithovirus LCPAC403]
MNQSTGLTEFGEICRFMKDNDKALRKEIPQLFEEEIQDQLISLCEKWENTPSTLEDLFELKNNHVYLHRPMGVLDKNHNGISKQLFDKWTLYYRTATVFRMKVMRKAYEDQR